jgi:hypothetical protein
MRPFRLARYAVVALLFLGLSVNLVFRPPVTEPRVVGFAAAVALAVLVAWRASQEQLTWVVRGALVVAVVEFFIEWFGSLEKGYAEASCTPDTCSFPPPVDAIAPSLWAFVGASALLLVIASLRQRRQRQRQHGRVSLT